jgi:hypothetical protein
MFCDGICFEFFCFDSTKSPTFSRSVFHPPGSPPVKMLAVAQCSSTTDQEFTASLRPICETLFYVLLLTYKTGMGAYMGRSVAADVKENLGWNDAYKLAGEALTLAVCASVKAATDVDDSDEMASSALGYLRQRSVSPICHPSLWNLLFFPFQM